MLKVSYNRGAQTMICRLAVAAGSTDCDAGMPKAAAIWRKAGLDTTGAVLVDGSGLSGNLITPDNEVQLQTIMTQRPDAAAWQAALPILGVDGSLAQVQAGGPATGKVFAKTGVARRAGLLQRQVPPARRRRSAATWTRRAGRRFAFAIVVTNSVFGELAGVLEANDDVGKVAATIQQTY